MDPDDLTTHTPEQLQEGITLRLREQERRRLLVEPADEAEALRQRLAELDASAADTLDPNPEE